MNHDLTAFGWNAAHDHLLPPGCQPARVLSQHRGRWRVAASSGELGAEAAGRLRHGADPAELPVTGDWVAVAVREGEGQATIHAVLPRRSCLARRDPGPITRAQPVAANVDLVLLVAAADGYRAVNPRRLERAAAIAWESGASPVLVLSKCDLVPDLRDVLAEASGALPGVPAVAIGIGSDHGIDELRALLSPARTAVLLGPSGAGKSTLTNRLLGAARQSTGDVRDVDGKGRHTTTSRELFLVPTGGAVIDTPGIRGLGLWSDDGGGVAEVFSDVEDLASGCRFRDCGHDGEPGCAVRAAVETGGLDEARVEAWIKLQRELAFVARKRDTEARRIERAHGRKQNRALQAWQREKGRDG